MMFRAVQIVNLRHYVAVAMEKFVTPIIVTLLVMLFLSLYVIYSY